MELKRLQYFVALAANGNFTKTADQLNIAQSALSVSMQKLEKEIGLKLINRTNRQIQLTSDGMRLLFHARRILEDVALAEIEMDELKGLERGKIDFGVSAMLGSYFFPEALAAFTETYPNIRIHIQEHGTATLEKMLLEGALDLAFVRTDQPLEQLRYVALCPEEIVACVNKSHPFAQRSEVSLEQFCQQPLILFRDGYLLREAISRYCRNNNITPDIRYETNLIELVKALLKKDIGISTCLRRIIHDNEPLVCVPFNPPIKVEFGIGWKSSHYLSNAARAFLKFMEDWHKTNR
ncbi:LysR family transcriptional regulator [Vibrio furnissii]|uniref:LysR family transcriptional regulator n=1 Tax=Vibrio furnissii TaxID=29494 RepID=UPI001302A9CD|nr:LysR family transcriptional regulator [Vibrio furnissii]MCG6210572.1 LysR family transcriptional regulator [Vibrio furnissii]MCG6228948.1 LysR family transcriptional regulator [Vibrio furnissii]MCG6232952.1 LysR family transcriptional regulator [Vibrio furnissii]MCG6257802.1 LysR family transcriptional regulator [Vibrio furnissii]MCG6267161.1 LysR family transcriptional regulator [Vibrio furnissii]